MAQQMTTAEKIAMWRAPETIRSRCRMVFDYVQAGHSEHFQLDLSQLDLVAKRLLALMQERFPDGKVPYHSRFRHFTTSRDGHYLDRSDWLRGQISDPLTLSRSFYELVIVSVLLDAGAGDEWQFHEASTGFAQGRSEGLALASIDMFMKGLFGAPMAVTQKGLQGLTLEDLADGFQVTAMNPLVGLEGRLELLRRLGSCIDSSWQDGRLGGFFDEVLSLAEGGAGKQQIRAKDILHAVLSRFSSIWPSGVVYQGINLGDVAQHKAIKIPHDPFDHYVPYHKLSQWLTYSLMEPLEWYGIKVVDLDDLTGLPEYRNGGLFVDFKVIIPRDHQAYGKQFAPDSEFIVEWRSLTVCLIDLLADQVRHLAKTPQLSLASILEAGTWTLGRVIAKELRPKTGAPPFNIKSSGTIF